MKVAIVGAGAAGVAAATWLDKFGYDFDWFERDGKVGGMLHSVHNAVRDYPAHSAASGAEFAAHLESWSGIRPIDGTIVRIHAANSTDPDSDRFEIHRSDGSSSTYAALVLATGTAKRRLHVPGEEAGLEDWVRLSVARDTHRYADKVVAVVGGADSALEGCIRLAEAGASKVYLIARSELRARLDFIRRLPHLPAVEVLRIGRRVVAIDRSDNTTHVGLDDGSTLRIDTLFVRIGVDPVHPSIDPKIRVDERGFVVVDERKATNIAGLFAAGDVTSSPLRSIATSVADGAVAAQSVVEFLERR